MTEPRFLVVRLGSLGDIVHTFPAVAALRESFPAADIVWLTHPRWRPLVASSSLPSEILAVDTRSTPSLREVIGKIRAARWDFAIDYQGLWKSALLPFLGGVRRRIGFSSGSVREFGVPLLYTDRVTITKSHIAQQNGELSLRAGARTTVAPCELRVHAESQSIIRDLLAKNGMAKYVVLSPGGGWRSKCWPAERYGALCRLIRESLDLRCVINYGPGEEGLRDAVKAASADAEPLAYNGNLGTLMALLQNAACIVGGDTGPLHLGVALGAPAVAIFGPTDPVRNGPFWPRRFAAVSCAGNKLESRTPAEKFSVSSTGDAVLRATGASTSHKRREDPDSSILAIDLDSVFEAVRWRLGVTA